MCRKFIITILTVFALCTANISFAADAGPFNVQVLLPGMTKRIEIRQQQVLPLGCPQFFIFTIGPGMLGISLKKDDVAGDVLFMVGFASAGGKILPVRRIGSSAGMIDQIIEIKGDSNVVGFVWLWCGVATSQSVPVFFSELRLSLQP